MRALLLLLALAPAPLLAVSAAELGVATASTATVQVGPLTLQERDLLVTLKGDYAFALLDLLAQRQALAAAGAAGRPEALAQACVEGVLAKRHPKLKRFKVVLAEVAERDNYDAPRWSTVRILARYEAAKAGQRWSLKKVAK